jgi:sugar/nucleoside kinase (ribokinase family)
MVDVVVAGHGHDARVRLSPGGSAGNAAVWAALLGAQAQVVGRVGDDAAGRLLRSELEARGVRSLLSVDPAAPTGTFVTVDESIRADRGANARFDAADLPSPLEGDVVLVSGHLPPAAAAAALAHALAAWVALDAARLTELPAAGNAVLANEEGARRLTGRRPEEAVRELGRGYRLACVTRGAGGAVAALDGAVESATAPPVDVVDPTGAGDAFAAGLLVALARGAPLAEALVQGCRRGAEAAAAAGTWPSVLN